MTTLTREHIEAARNAFDEMPEFLGDVDYHALCDMALSALRASPRAEPVACNEPHELLCPHCNPCRHRERLNEYDSVLRGLCSLLGADGYNVTHQGLIDPESADEKIRWGIDHVIGVERTRPSAAAQIVEMCEPAKCLHEAYQGYCAHCNAPMVNGMAVVKRLSPATPWSVVVPVEPTEAMLNWGSAALVDAQLFVGNERGRSYSHAVYKAMLAASKGVDHE